MVDRLKQRYGDDVEFRILNVETDTNARALAASLGVTGVPTFFFVNSDGVQAGQIVGGATETQLASMIEQLQ